jgi:hypothetical protein
MSDLSNLFYDFNVFGGHSLMMIFAGLVKKV